MAGFGFDGNSLRGLGKLSFASFCYNAWSVDRSASRCQLRSEIRETSLAPRRRGRAVHIGDVFQIPIDDARVGYGQVIAQHLSSYLVALFKTARPAEEAVNVPSIISDDVAFFAETLDAKLWNRDWPVVGNVPPDWSRIQLPNYKVAFGRADNMHVEAYDGKRHRPATQQEIQILRFRTVCSARHVQQAFQGFQHTISSNDRDADVLEPEYCQRSAEISLSRLPLPGWKSPWTRLSSLAPEPPNRSTCRLVESYTRLVVRGHGPELSAGPEVDAAAVDVPLIAEELWLAS